MTPETGSDSIAPETGLDTAHKITLETDLQVKKNADNRIKHHGNTAENRIRQQQESAGKWIRIAEKMPVTGSDSINTDNTGDTTYGSE